MPSQNASETGSSHANGFKNRKASDSFHEILRVNKDDGLGDVLAPVTDGKGAVTPLAISDTQVAINDMVWPTTGAEEGSVLRVSTTSNQLEWFKEEVDPNAGSGEFDETAFWMGTV